LALRSPWPRRAVEPGVTGVEGCGMAAGITPVARWAIM